MPRVVGMLSSKVAVVGSVPSLCNKPVLYVAFEMETMWEFCYS